MKPAARHNRRKPGEVRDAIVQVLSENPGGSSIGEISSSVQDRIGSVPGSSIRSYLQLNTPELFVRMDRGQYVLKGFDGPAGAKDLAPPALTPRAMPRQHRFPSATLFLDDCNAWLERQAGNSVHAVLTDPPYGLLEYTAPEQQKLRSGKGGVWRIPPSFDGAKRAPLPRFTVLKREDLASIDRFFEAWSRRLLRVLVPGANVLVASNPLLSHRVAVALEKGGLERRGEIIRRVMTMRGGDRPKAAHVEFDQVSVMPRSMWEPWLMFRKPLEGRVQDNLRRWGTGGFRRIGPERPFGDVIDSAPTRAAERQLANHPSLKPQAFLRKVARGILPLGTGVILDPFAGSGSTLAAAQAVGYEALGVESDEHYFDLAIKAVPRLTQLAVPLDETA